MSNLCLSPFFMMTLQGGELMGHDLLGGKRYKNLSPQVLEIALAGVDGLEDGALEAGVAEQAQKIGLLINPQSQTFKDISLWETNYWLSGAFLTYSEMNRPYLEDMVDTREISTVTAVRGKAMESKLRQEAYPQPHRPQALIPLPEARMRESVNLKALYGRRSCRKFLPQPLSLQELSDLLGNAFVAAKKAHDLRTESTDPADLIRFSMFNWLEVHLVAQQVEGLEAGHYRYDIAQHGLERLGGAIDEKRIAETIQNQGWISGGGIAMFLTVDWRIYQWPYVDSRAYTILLMELGRAGQMVFQAAYERGLAGWGTPAVDEDKAALMLGLDAETRDAMYFLKIGKPGK